MSYRLITCSGLQFHVRRNSSNLYLQILADNDLDMRTVQKLVLRLAKRMCFLFHNHSTDLHDELISIGWVRSIEITENYNAARGFSLIACLWKGIFGTMHRYCRQQTDILAKTRFETEPEQIAPTTPENSGIINLDITPYSAGPEQIYRRKEIKRKITNISRDYGYHGVELFDNYPCLPENVSSKATASRRRTEMLERLKKEVLPTYSKKLHA